VKIHDSIANTMEKTEFHEFQGALIPDDDFPAPWELWSSNNSDIYPILKLPKYG